MKGKEFLDTFSASASRGLSNLLEQAFGTGVNHTIAGAVTWADLIVLACFIAVVVVVNSILAAFIRRKRKHAAADTESGSWRVQLMNAIGKPLYLLVWIYGVYFAATPLLARTPQEGAPHPARLFFDMWFDLGFFVALFWFFFRLTRVIEVRLSQLAARTNSKLDDLVVPLVGRTLRLIVPALGIIFALPVLGLSEQYAGVISKGGSILIVLAVAWIFIQAVNTGEKYVLTKYDINAADNLQARKVYTQVHVLSKTLHVIIVIFTVASVLMMFEEVRRFGTSLLASAGVVGIIIGFAAQRTIANLFAGFQLAMTQPIRLDDVVIVENEWGRVEEITLTYVVVRIWDERRLIVPLSYFIEKPFQNWTRVSAEILGSVMLWVDYTLPISEVRQAVGKIVEAHPLWDRRFWNLQVTDTNERAMQIRVLVTASDSGKAWDMRCDIREKLLAYLQDKYVSGLPRMRAELSSLEKDGTALPDAIPNAMPKTSPSHKE